VFLESKQKLCIVTRPDDTDEVCSAVSPDTRRRYVASESLGWIKKLIQKKDILKLRTEKLRGANMRKISYWTAVLLIACLTVLTPLTVSAQSGNITCESMLGQYQYCPADTQNEVRLTTQTSSTSCTKDYSWGYDYRGIWVDRGCRAEFAYGRSSGGGKGGLIAAGILGAIFLGVAAGSSKSRNSGGGGNVDPQKMDTYNQGYRYGGQDWDQGIPPNYRSHNNHYTSQYESDFASGYDDGYHHRSHK
jgi:hypothetical protein